MTLNKFFGFGAVMAGFFVLAKLFSYKVLNWELSVSHYIYFVLVGTFSVALIRRLGHINVLEAIAAIVIWIIFALFLDLIITAQILGPKIFLDLNFYIGYLVMAVFVFIFHKKRHVEIRKKLKEQ